MAETLVNEYPEVELATRIQHTPNMLVRYQDKVFNETRFLWVDSNFFDVFSVRMIHGDPKTALKDDHTVVMTLETARKYFENPADAINKIVNYEDATPYRVTGIIANAPENAHFHYGMLSPLSSWEWNWRQFWLNHSMFTYVVLPENHDPGQLEAKFPAFIRKYVAPHIKDGLGMSMEEFETSGSTLEYFLQPITSIHLHSQLNGELEPNSDIKYVYIFSLVAFFILVIAGINFMNLSTARSTGRGKEVGVRKVLGSSRQQLIRQFLFESFLLTFAALLIALILVEILLPFFNRIAGKTMDLRYFDNWYIFPGLLIFTLVVGFLAGIYPAFFLASFRPVWVLKGAGSLGKNGKSPLRSALVVFQFAISIFLFISTFTVYQQLKYVQNKRLGFNKENVLVIKRGWAIGQKPDGSLVETPPNETVIDAFKYDLLQNPQIIAVSGTGGLPGKEFNSAVAIPEGAPRDEQHPIHWFLADYDYAETLDLELVEGRFFSRDVSSDTGSAVVINEAAGRALGFEKPYLGKRVGFPDNREFYLDIIGVVKDFHYESLHKKIDPLVIGLQNLYRTYVAVRIHPHNIPETVVFIEKTWSEYIPYKPFEYFFLDDDYDALYRAEQRTGELFTVFSVFAILIACLGLLGLASFTTEQRTKEIGIRKALGASVSNIVMKLSQEFTKWVLIANIFAWPLAWYFMDQWLRDFAYRIDIGILPFILAGFAALLIALLTISYQAIKAALTNPVESLRYE
jgi:putative ABC transport system permease protein